MKFLILPEERWRSSHTATVFQPQRHSNYRVSWGLLRFKIIGHIFSGAWKYSEKAHLSSTPYEPQPIATAITEQGGITRQENASMPWCSSDPATSFDLWTKAPITRLFWASVLWWAGPSCQCGFSHNLPPWDSGVITVCGSCKKRPQAREKWCPLVGIVVMQRWLAGRRGRL